MVPRVDILESVVRFVEVGNSAFVEVKSMGRGAEGDCAVTAIPR